MAERLDAMRVVLQSLRGHHQASTMSVPHLPYVGDQWREGPRVAIIGRADLNWPPTALAGECELKNLDDAFSVSPAKVLEESDAISRRFMTEAVAAGGEKESRYHSAWWRFCGQVVERAAEEDERWRSAAREPFSALAVANLYPVCRQADGNPRPADKKVMKPYAQFLGRWLRAIDANAVVYAVGDSWVHDILQMVPGASVRMANDVACLRNDHSAMHEPRDWMLVGGPAGGIVAPHPERKSNVIRGDAACAAARIVRSHLRGIGGF